MADENVVATPEAPAAPAAPAADSGDTVITADDLESNKFSSDKLAEALENMKAGKVKKAEAEKAAAPAPVEPAKPAEAAKPAEVATPEGEPIAPEPKPTEPTFDEKVAAAVEAKLKAEGFEKVETPSAPPKPPEAEFSGFKDAKELEEAYAKDPKGTFEKVVEWKVKQEMAAFKTEFMKQMEPVTADLEKRTVNTHLEEAKKDIKELADPKFYKQVMDWMGNKANGPQFNAILARGENPYKSIGEIVRGKNVGNYEKAAYERGVKETEARLAKAGRAVVEGGGKVTVESEGIDLEKASADQIYAELAKHGKAPKK